MTAAQRNKLQKICMKITAVSRNKWIIVAEWDDEVSASIIVDAHLTPFIDVTVQLACADNKIYLCVKHGVDRTDYEIMDNSQFVDINSYIQELTANSVNQSVIKLFGE